MSSLVNAAPDIVEQATSTYLEACPTAEQGPKLSMDDHNNTIQMHKRNDCRLLDYTYVHIRAGN